MTEKEKLIEEEFKGIDQALRRAAQTAKRTAEKNDTPYVIKKDDSKDKLQQNIVTYKP